MKHLKVIPDPIVQQHAISKSHNHDFKPYQNGNYICKNYNLVIEVPKSYDTHVLSLTDYLKVFSLQLLFTYFDILIALKVEKPVCKI